MFNSIKTWFGNIWNDIKAWFKYSWSVFIARLEVLAGILIGALGGIDWTALASLDWSDLKKNTGTLIVAGLLIVKGVISEIGRRAGTVEINSQLVPVNIADEIKK